MLRASSTAKLVPTEGKGQVDLDASLDRMLLAGHFDTADEVRGAIVAETIHDLSAFISRQPLKTRQALNARPSGLQHIFVSAGFDKSRVPRMQAFIMNARTADPLQYEPPKILQEDIQVGAAPTA